MMLAYLDQRRRSVHISTNGVISDESLPLSLSTEEEEETDFGGVYRSRPLAVIRPTTPDDVTNTVHLAISRNLHVSARGNGHSVSGQAMADGGFVLHMRSLSPRKFNLISAADSNSFSADVSGGALWEELLAWSVTEFGLAPVTWTDYLGLTIGGTLSNGGISGQAFKWGPQVSMVEELEVVVAVDGSRRVCSPETNSELFFAVLGGLGQFGIITRARIPLFPAPPMVKWIRLVYADFATYAKDAERLITRPENDSFDYIEGFAFINKPSPADGWDSVPIGDTDQPRGFNSDLVPGDAGPLLYCLEVALHYQLYDNVDKRGEEMLKQLRYIRGLEYESHVSYVEFLSRVKRAEEEARANGSWNSPHPWLNLLVSAADIADFERHVLGDIVRDGIGGPMLIYPMLKSKWDPRTSVEVPENEIFYLVALLRFSRPYPDGPPMEELVAQNRQIIKRCETNGYDYKIYLPHYESEEEWEKHFGKNKNWSRFIERKKRFDPMAILAPGQKIFTRPLDR